MVKCNRVCPALVLILAVFSVGPRGIAETVSTGLDAQNLQIPNPEIQSLEITVRLYNYAEVPGATLEQAQATAAQVFRRAGIETSWREAPLAPSEGSERSLLENPGAAILYLRILPKSMSGRVPAPRACFGFAHRKASIANVFSDRVKALAWDHVLDTGLVLGHLMAHEMGHLLLVEKMQSRKGIMSHRWKLEHFVTASMGQLGFGKREAVALRTTLHGRLRTAGVREALRPDRRLAESEREGMRQGDE